MRREALFIVGFVLVAALAFGAGGQLNAGSTLVLSPGGGSPNPSTAGNVTLSLSDGPVLNVINGTTTTATVTSGVFKMSVAFSFADAQETMTDSDDTPDVSDGSYFITGNVTDTITDFDGTGITIGQLIFVESDAAITYDVTGAGLICGDTDIVTADGDTTGWFYDGTDWHCFFFQDLDDNANTWGAA